MNSSVYQLSAIIAVFTTMVLYSAYDDTLNIHKKDDYGNTLLHKAIQDNQIEIVKFLLDHGANIHAMNYHGHTPLHIAAIYNRLEIAQLLLDHGANIHAQSENIYSDDILLKAVMFDHPEMIKLLIKHKARLDSSHVQFRSSDTIRDLLIILGAGGSLRYGPINSRILSKASVLTQTNYYEDQTSDILHIQEDLATLEAQEQQTTPQYDQLYKAVVAGDVDAVTSMLTAQDSPCKQYINTQDALGATLLMYAAAREHYDIVKLLLEHGAIPTIGMCNGMNIFSLADTILQNKNDMKDILCLCLKPIAKMLLLHQKRLNPLQKLPRDMIYLLLDTMTHGIAKKYQLLVRCKQQIGAREHIVQRFAELIIIVQTISPLLILTIHYCLHKE